MAPQHGHNKGQDGSDALVQLDIERGRNDQKLKSRFEHIFRKYEHDFTGVGDEFDIHTDEIVVNNGHLEHMRSEVDSGTTASSHFVKTFRDKLAHEDESGSSDEEEGDNSDDDDGTSMQSDDSDEGLEDTDTVQSMRGTPAASRPTRSGVGVPKAVSLGPDRRPPRLPQLMQLLAGEGTSRRPLENPDDHESEDESVSSEATTCTTTANAVLERGRDRRQSSYAESRAGSQRPQADDDTVQALGMSIANQLAKLIGATSKKKKKKSTAMHRAADPVWSYPEIDHSSKTKRKRSKSPIPQPQLSSPSAISPDNRSLWAVSDSTRSTKRRRSERASSAASTVVRRFGKASDSAESKRCWNCSLTRSSSWQKGPHGQDLCQSCGQYYEHHGRMKGFDSLTPPPVDEQQTIEQDNAVRVSAASEVPVAPEPQRPSCEVSITTADQGDQRNVLERTPQIAATPVRDELRATPAVAYTANTSRQMANSDGKRRAWSVEEDALIIRLKEYDRLSWDAIADHFPGRAASAIQKNYSCKLKGVDCPARVLFNDQLHADDIAGNVAGVETNGTGAPDWQWSAQQDELLLELREGDELEWNEISDILPGHSPAAVERRYDILAGPRPNSRQPVAIEQSPNAETAWPTLQRYTAEEDALIIQLREVESLSWQQIAQRFDNRSVHSLQSRYSVALNPLKREGTPAVSVNAAASYIAGGRNVMPHRFSPAIVSGQSSSEPQSRRSRHSLPTAMATSRRSGNALLRQALGNSHRRRSYHGSFMPMYAASPEPFALDPRLREPDSALHATEGGGNNESPVMLDYVDSSAASLQLEVEMQRAQVSQSEVSMHDTTPSSTPDTAHGRASIASHRNTKLPTVVPSQRASVQPRTATKIAVDHALIHYPSDTPGHPTSRVQPVYLDDAEDDAADDADDAPYMPNANDLRTAARQDSPREGPPRTRGRKHLERRKPAKHALLADDANDSLADLTSPLQESSVRMPNDTLGLAHPPQMSFTQLVAMAFSAKSTTSMSIKEICSWIETSYGYYSTAPRGWKNGVREELRTNEKYEVSIVRQRNSVWRIKAQESDEPSTEHDVTVDDTYSPDIDDTPTIPDSDEAEAVITTPALRTARSSKRRVTFSPVVTVTTPVPVMRLKPRQTSSRQRLAAKPTRKKSTDALEIPNSASPSASPLETTTSVPKSVPNADADPLFDDEPAADDARRTSRKASNRSGQSQKHKDSAITGPMEENLSADSSRAPSSVVNKTPASIFKTPKQPGWPRIPQLKPYTDPTRRHSTPIINHKFMTPNAGLRKRVVETPVRELCDPEEDELAG